MKDSLIGRHKESSPNKESQLNHLLIACLSFAVLVTVIAFVRERRLRLALQRIVNRLFAHWRTHAKNHNADSDRRDRNRLPE